MISLTEENYLKALFHLSSNNGEVNVNELSKQLGIKMPTVTSMMKKLAAKEYVNYESYKPLKLTTKGRIAAALIIRKHRLTEMYLVEKMGFGWEEVHEIALTPASLSRTTLESLSTLLHEMVHCWQQCYGKPDKNGYHNKQWANKMKDVGLTPFSILDSKRETGFKCSHEIFPNSVFTDLAEVFVKQFGDIQLQTNYFVPTNNKVTVKKRPVVKCQCGSFTVPFGVNLKITCITCGDEVEISDEI